MPATKLYIELSNPRAFCILDVFDWKVTHWREPMDYRDDWDQSKPGRVSCPTAGGLLMDTDDGAEAIGADGAAPVSASGFLNLRYAAPDKKTHTPPRIAWLPKRGYAFSIVEAVVVPAVAEPDYKAKVFTAATTDVCTSTAHTFDNGDLVTAHTTSALPAGLVSTAIYTLIKIDADTFKLALNGAVVDITGTGTGTHTVVLVSPARLPARSDGIIYYSDERTPVISTADPR